MVLTPDQPFPKTRGHAIRSKDWNDAIGELQRLDTAKVNKAGDSLTGPLTISGTVGIGTTNPQHGRLMIEDASVPLSLRETGQSLTAGGLWRMPLDGGVLRLEVNTAAGGDFSTTVTPLAMTPAGNVGIGTTAPQHARLMIEATTALLSLRQTGQTLTAGGLWRMPLDNGTLCFDVNTAGAGNFSTFIRSLAMTPAGNIGIGTGLPQHGRLMIEDASVPLSLRETGQSLIAGGLWRMPLDGGVLRFEVNTSGAGDFTTFISPLAMRADGNVSFGGRVGIGTTAPNEELDVVGDIFLRGSLRFPNAATPMMFIYESGFQNQDRVVIAHSPAAPTQGLHYRDSGDKMFFRLSENSLVALTVDLSLGRVGVLTDSPSFPLHVVGDAFKTTGTAWTTSSDERLKKRIRQLNGVLGRLSRLRGVSFEWQKPEEHGNLTGTQMGLVAQEVEEVFPEWVDANPDGYKTLTLRGFEALTVEAFKELVAENETLKAKSNKLEDRIKDLESSTFGEANDREAGDAGGIDATQAAQRRAGELGVRLSDVKGTGAGGCALVQDIEEAAKG